jgi:hypothetical protein
MFSYSWIRHLFGMKSKSPARRRPRPLHRARLALEALEERLAPAMVFQVNTFNDTHAAVFPGIDASGNTSLRAAIDSINVLQDGYTNGAVIYLPAGTYDLSLGELNLNPQAQGLPVTIIGQGSNSQATVIDAQGLSRVLEVHSGVGSITLENLTVQNGRATDGGAAGSSFALGGGILDESAPLSLQAVNVLYNSAISTGGDALGGGVFASSSSVTISSTTIAFNNVSAGNARGYGGGVAIDSGTLNVINSTFEGNSVSSGNIVAGGALYAATTNVALSGTILLSNSVTGNPYAPTATLGSTAEGGGIAFTTLGGVDDLTISGSGITYNSATAGAGGSGVNEAIGPSGGGAAGGFARGGGIYVGDVYGNGSGATGTPVVNISGSNVDVNSVQGGAGGAGGVGPSTQVGILLGGRQTITGTGGVGGFGGSAFGGGIDVENSNSFITLASSNFNLNSATSGNGGAGGPGGIGDSTIGDDVEGGQAVFNGGDGGEGGPGGEVMGGGAELNAFSTTVTDTTFSSNTVTGGSGGNGGAGGAPISNGSGGKGGDAGAGGSAFGAAVAGSPLGNAFSLSGVTAQQNVARGGAGGAGGAGGGGTNTTGTYANLNLTLAVLGAFDPAIGAAGLLAGFIESTPAAAGGLGGAGGPGGDVGGAISLANFQVNGLTGVSRVDASAVVDNSGYGGVGGAGGNGGAGGSGSNGANAGGGGAAGSGGYGIGGGITDENGPVLVTDTTIDGNSVTAGLGGAFGLPGLPGQSTAHFLTDYVFLALNTVVGIATGGLGSLGYEAASLVLSATKPALPIAERYGNAKASVPQEVFLYSGTPGAVAADGAQALAGVAGGGGVYAAASGNLTLINDTITRNTSDVGGGVYAANNATVNIGNTVVAQDTGRAAEPDVASFSRTLNSLGHNFIGIDTADVSGFNQAGDRTGTTALPLDPLLGDLQMNGPTLSRKPLLDSPLIGTGDPGLTGTNTYYLPTDQAGNSRTRFLTTDIGSIEALSGITVTTLIVNSTDSSTTRTDVLTLPEAVALTNGTLSYASLSPQQRMQLTQTPAIAGDTIQFAPTLAGATINLSAAQATGFGPSALVITSPVTIMAPAGGITISRDATVSNLRLFEVGASGNLTLQGVTLSQGQALGGNGADGISGGGGGGGGAGLGGAVLNFGTLNIQSSNLLNNVAHGGNGGVDTVIPHEPGDGAHLFTYQEVGAAGGGPFAGQAGQGGSDLGGGGGGGSYGVSGGSGSLGGGGGSDGSGIPGTSGTHPGVGGLGGGNGIEQGIAQRGVDGGGGGGGLGGAIFNAGTLTISGSALAGNSAIAGLGAGHAASGMGLGGAVFNYNGTATVTSSTFTANTADQGAAIDNVGDGMSGVVPVGTATVALSSATLADNPPAGADYQQTTINTGLTVNTGNATIQGLPSGPIQTGSPLQLTAPITSSTNGILWQATSGSSTTLAAQGLTFVANNPVILPNGVINGAANLSVDLTFQTTSGGVLLGYQDQPLGTAPSQYVPALYVGVDGRLYAELYDGALQPIMSSGQVNDGQMHHVVFTLSGGTQTLTLDGNVVGTINASPNPLNMLLNQLGTGYTGFWPGGNGGVYPFNGTIGQVVISSNGQMVYSGQNLVFQPTKPVALPSSLIHDATSLSVDVTFHTTAGGVILGYQNAPSNNVPGNYVPALYVGTDGKLYGSVYSLGVIHTSAAVNDGTSHRAVLTVSGSTLSLSLDGVPVGQTTGNLSPIDMKFNQLGTGYSVGYPAGVNNAPDPFVGTLEKVLISTNGALPGSVMSPTSTSSQFSLTPSAAGTYAVSLESINSDGGVGQSSGSVTVVSPPSFAFGFPAGSIQVGKPITVTASTPGSTGGLTSLWQITNPSGKTATSSGALQFNGVNQFVDLGRPTDLNFSGQITLEAWIKPGSTAGLQDIISHGYQTSPNLAEVFLRINNGTYQVGSWNGNNSFASAAMPATDVGQWVHLAGVYNGTQWLLYRNGVLITGSTPSTQGALTVDSTNWAIGARGTGTERFFQGSIDNVSIWHVGRSAAQIQAEMSSGLKGSETGLVAYYRLDETSGLQATDATANHNDGKLGGGNLALAPTRVAGVVLGKPTLSFTPGVAGNYTVNLEVVQPGGFTSVASGSLTLSAGAPAGVDIHGQPANGVVDKHIGGPITVAVVDAYKNTDTSSSALVTLRIASGPAGAKLGGTTTVRAVHGVATFTDLTLNVAGTYTLEATGGTLTPDFSNPFTIKAADISDDVTIHRRRLHEVHGSDEGVVKQTLTITNTSGHALAGPLAVAVQHLPPGVTLANASGTFEGKPYLDISSVGATLASGQEVEVTLKFFVGRRHRDRDSLTYSTEILQGIG